MTECKKNEILHMFMLNPDLIILDEIDEGVHEDELELLAGYIKLFLSDQSKAAIVVTHSHALLNILEPTHVHIMVDGTIRETGSAELYKRIVEDGYTQFS
jgi:Fe-S cluster assembly ATP-binding protein